METWGLETLGVSHLRVWRMEKVMEHSVEKEAFHSVLYKSQCWKRARSIAHTQLLSKSSFPFQGPFDLAMKLLEPIPK